MDSLCMRCKETPISKQSGCRFGQVQRWLATRKHMYRHAVQHTMGTRVFLHCKKCVSFTQGG